MGPEKKSTYVLTVPGCTESARMSGYLLASSLLCRTLASFEWPYRAQTEKAFIFISEKIMPSFGASLACPSLDTFTMRTLPLSAASAAVCCRVGRSKLVNRKWPM